MSIESHLVIGENPDKHEVVIVFDPEQLGINAVERLFRTLVATQERKKVFAFGDTGNLIIFDNDWFEATRRLPTPDQKDRLLTGIVNIMFSDRVIVSKTPPIT